MKEAVEIAKLRLFLKLVATVDADYRKPNLGLEPLPDIDFNIRAGNTLVGFATEKELEKCLVEDIMGAIVKQEIDEKCDVVAHAFIRYKEIQLKTGEDYTDFKTAKEELNKRLKELNNELNLLLHKQASGLKYDTWLTSHQPFHWFAEFYEIIHDRGGFDVIIGNPPYIEYNPNNTDYIVADSYFSGKTNLFALVLDRAKKFNSNQGSLGMIVLLSLTSTGRMNNLMNRLIDFYPSIHFSHYEGTSNPGTMFEGVKAQLNITIGHRHGDKIVSTSHYFRAYAEERKNLFEKLNYTPVLFNHTDRFPKFSQNAIDGIFGKVFSTKDKYFYHPGENLLFFRNMGNFFWKLAFTEAPVYMKNGVQSKSSTVSSMGFSSENERNAFICLINSSLFFIYWNVYSDCYHLSKKEITQIQPSLKLINWNWQKLVVNLMSSFKQNGYLQTENTKNGGIKEYFRYFPQFSKNIIDKIDQVLAGHYGFTGEELDFIINYDIKYRMGKELDAYIEGRPGKVKEKK